MKVVRKGGELLVAKSLDDYPAFEPSLDKAALRIAGISPPEPVLDILVRLPEIYLTGAASARHQEAGLLEFDSDLVHSVSIALARHLLLAKDCTDAGQTLETLKNVASREDLWVRQRNKFLDRLGALTLPQSRVEGQKWVYEGIYERIATGISEIRVYVEDWEMDVLVWGLSGELRSRLMQNYGKTKDDYALFRDTAIWAVRDPTGSPVFHSISQVDELHEELVEFFAWISLWLSGLLPERPIPLQKWTSGPTDRDDARYCLRRIHFSSADPAEQKAREDIITHWMWKHQNDWKAADRGIDKYIGKSFGNLLKKPNQLEGDRALKERLLKRGDDALEYLANRSVGGTSSKKGPDSSDYDGDAESAHGAFEWQADHELDKRGRRHEEYRLIETEDSRNAGFIETEKFSGLAGIVEIEEEEASSSSGARISPTSRKSKSSITPRPGPGPHSPYVYFNRHEYPSSLAGNDFEKCIDRSIDAESAIQHVYRLQVRANYVRPDSKHAAPDSLPARQNRRLPGAPGPARLRPLLVYPPNPPSASSEPLGREKDAADRVQSSPCIASKSLPCPNHRYGFPVKTFESSLCFVAAKRERLSQATKQPSDAVKKLASRDFQIFEMRHFDRLDRCDIPEFSVLTKKEIEAGWKNLDRNRGKVSAWLSAHGYTPRDLWWLNPPQPPTSAPIETRLAIAKMLLDSMCQWEPEKVGGPGAEWWTGPRTTKNGGWIAPLDFRPFGRDGGSAFFELYFDGSSWVAPDVETSRLRRSSFEPRTYSGPVFGEAWAAWRAKIDPGFERKDEGEIKKLAVDLCHQRFGKGVLDTVGNTAPSSMEAGDTRISVVFSSHGRKVLHFPEAARFLTDDRGELINWEKLMLMLGIAPNTGASECGRQPIRRLASGFLVKAQALKELCAIRPSNSDRSGGYLWNDLARGNGAYWWTESQKVFLWWPDWGQWKPEPPVRDGDSRELRRHTVPQWRKVLGCSRETVCLPANVGDEATKGLDEKVVLRISHSREDLRLGSLLAGNPIVGKKLLKTRYGTIFEYYTRQIAEGANLRITQCKEEFALEGISVPFQPYTKEECEDLYRRVWGPRWPVVCSPTEPLCSGNHDEINVSSHQNDYDGMTRRHRAGALRLIRENAVEPVFDGHALCAIRLTGKRPDCALKRNKILQTQQVSKMSHKVGSRRL